MWTLVQGRSRVWVCWSGSVMRESLAAADVRRQLHQNWGDGRTDDLSHGRKSQRIERHPLFSPHRPRGLMWLRWARQDGLFTRVCMNFSLSDSATPSSDTFGLLNY